MKPIQILNILNESVDITDDLEELKDIIRKAAEAVYDGQYKDDAKLVKMCIDQVDLPQDEYNKLLDGTNKLSDLNRKVSKLQKETNKTSSQGKKEEFAKLKVATDKIKEQYIQILKDGDYLSKSINRIKRRIKGLDISEQPKEQYESIDHLGIYNEYDVWDSGTIDLLVYPNTENKGFSYGGMPIGNIANDIDFKVADIKESIKRMDNVQKDIDSGKYTVVCRYDFNNKYANKNNSGKFIINNDGTIENIK